MTAHPKKWVAIHRREDDESVDTVPLHICFDIIFQAFSNDMSRTAFPGVAIPQVVIFLPTGTHWYVYDAKARCVLRQTPSSITTDAIHQAFLANKHPIFREKQSGDGGALAGESGGGPVAIYWRERHIEGARAVYTTVEYLDADALKELLVKKPNRSKIGVLTQYVGSPTKSNEMYYVTSEWNKGERNSRFHPTHMTRVRRFQVADGNSGRITISEGASFGSSRADESLVKVLGDSVASPLHSPVFSLSGPQRCTPRFCTFPSIPISRSCVDENGVRPFLPKELRIHSETIQDPEALSHFAQMLDIVANQLAVAFQVSRAAVRQVAAIIYFDERTENMTLAAVVSLNIEPRVFVFNFFEPREPEVVSAPLKSRSSLAQDHRLREQANSQDVVQTNTTNSTKSRVVPPLPVHTQPRGWMCPNCQVQPTTVRSHRCSVSIQHVLAHHDREISKRLLCVNRVLRSASSGRSTVRSMDPNPSQPPYKQRNVRPSARPSTANPPSHELLPLPNEMHSDPAPVLARLNLSIPVLRERPIWLQRRLVVCEECAIRFCGVELARTFRLPDESSKATGGGRLEDAGAHGPRPPPPHSARLRLVPDEGSHGKGALPSVKTARPLSARVPSPPPSPVSMAFTTNQKIHRESRIGLLARLNLAIKGLHESFDLPLTSHHAAVSAPSSKTRGSPTSQHHPLPVDNDAKLHGRYGSSKSTPFHSTPIFPSNDTEKDADTIEDILDSTPTQDAASSPRMLTVDSPLHKIPARFGVSFLVEENVPSPHNDEESYRVPMRLSPNVPSYNPLDVPFFASLTTHLYYQVVKNLKHPAREMVDIPVPHPYTSLSFVPDEACRTTLRKVRRRNHTAKELRKRLSVASSLMKDLSDGEIAALCLAVRNDTNR